MSLGVHGREASAGRRSRQHSHTMIETPELSVVVPVTGARQPAPLHERLTAALASLTSAYEIVLVDDRDRTARGR